MYNKNTFNYFNYFFKGPFLDHKDKNQVLLDVNRCGRRLPKGEDERRGFNYRV